MTADPAIDAAKAAFRKAEADLPAAWEDPYGYTAEVVELVVAAVRPVILEEAAAAINAQCCHADERWNVQYTADDCQFCQPVMKAVRALGETQA